VREEGESMDRNGLRNVGAMIVFWGVLVVIMERFLL
jgi:hypothetical protein